MEFAPFRNWTRHLLMTFLILLAAAHAQMAASQLSGKNSCDELRQRLTANFLQISQMKVPEIYLSQLLPKYVESLLPSSCVQAQDAANFNPASTTDNGGPLGTLGGTGTIYAMSTTRRKREVQEQEDINYELGVSRAKRSTSTTTVTEEDGMPTAMDITNLVDNESPLAREKRFLSGMTFSGGLGGPSSMTSGGPQREVSESAQMFNTLLMFTKLQRNRWSQQTNRIRSGNLGTDRVSFQNANGMYGDPYPGRRKREVAPALEENLIEANLIEEPNSRQKRFLLPAAEPGEGPPSMMSVMMGTAVDPNTGKRIDPAGDYAKNMMRQAFMASTPFGAMTPPGKEPPEFVKKAAPAWFFSQMQRAFNPQPTFGRSYGFNRMASIPSQRLQPGGYYGDRFPGKRKKRSTDAVDGNSMPAYSEADSTSNSEHNRQKRATSDNANDVITVGDVSIPLDFFKPRERSDDIKYYDHRPHHPPPPQTYYPPPPQQQPPPVQTSYHHNQAYNRHQQQQKDAYIRYLYNRLLAQQAAQQQASRLLAAYQNHYAQYTQPTYPAQTQAPYTPPQAPYIPPQTRPPYVPPQTRPPYVPPQTQKPYVPPPPPQKPFVPPPKPFVPPPQPPAPPAAPHQPPPTFSAHHRPPPQFLDPFIHPPQGPPPPAQGPPPPSRKKRSDNSDKGSSPDNFFWPSSFFAPSFFNRRSYIPPYSSGHTRKVGYQSPKGTLVYGDRIPGAQGGLPKYHSRQAIESPAIPRGWAGTRPKQSAPGRRVKRANKEFTDQAGYYDPFFPVLPSWNSPFRPPYIPPTTPRYRYSPHSTKLAYRTGTGSLVYGDRFPGSHGRRIPVTGVPFPHRTPYGLPGPYRRPPAVGGPLPRTRPPALGGPLPRTRPPALGGPRPGPRPPALGGPRPGPPLGRPLAGSGPIRRGG